MVRKIFTILLLQVFLHGSLDMVLVTCAIAAGQERTADRCVAVCCSDSPASGNGSCASMEHGHDKAKPRNTGGASLSCRACGPFSRDATVKDFASDSPRLVLQFSELHKVLFQDQDWLEQLFLFFQDGFAATVFHPP